MQVPCDEGIANHIGPKPCADIREDVGEASAGVRAGQPWSRERKLVPGADAVCVAEGSTSACAIASVRATRGVVVEPGMHGNSLHGTRELSSLTTGGGMRRRPASGRRGAEADDVRTGEVTLTGSTDEVGEQNGLACGGVDGGKRWDREECGTAQHGPDSAPAKLCHRRTPAYVGP